MYLIPIHNPIHSNRGYLVWWNGDIYLLGGSNVLQFGAVLDKTTSVKKATFDLQTTTVYSWDAVPCTSHSSKVKTQHIYPFLGDEMWVKWPDVFVQKRWKALIQHWGNSRLCSRYFDKEKISTDGYRSGDSVLRVSSAPLHILFRGTGVVCAAFKIWVMPIHKK